MKIKKFHSSEYTVKKMNMHATDWEKMLSVHMYDRGLVSRTLINNLIKQCTKRLFTNEDTQMASKHMNIWSILIREIQIKSTTTYQYTSSKMDKIKITEDIKWR